MITGDHGKLKTTKTAATVKMPAVLTIVAVNGWLQRGRLGMRKDRFFDGSYFSKEEGGCCKAVVLHNPDRFWARDEDLTVENSQAIQH